MAPYLLELQLLLRHGMRFLSNGRREQGDPSIRRAVYIARSGSKSVPSGLSVESGNPVVLYIHGAPAAENYRRNGRCNTGEKPIRDADIPLSIAATAVVHLLAVSNAHGGPIVDSKLYVPANASWTLLATSNGDRAFELR